ncbi:MAG: G1 family glutamic endopeptidase [Candidatus Limnocylindrales bacterium]
MRWLRRLAIPVLVAVLAGFASTAQAGSSGLSRPGYTVVVRPPMIGAASRVDLAALLRTGTRTPPAGISSRQLARVAPRLAAVAATGNVFNSVSSTSITSNNWSGYVVGDGPYTSVTGTFTVPGLAASPTETVTSEWVGIDGSGGTSSLIQAGVTETYKPSANLVYTQGWWEILPAPSTLITTMAVTPGDSVTVTIGQISGTLWWITVADDTTGQSFTTDQTYTGPGTSAEWIVEAPTDSLTNTEDTLGAYNPPVTFSNLRMGGPETTLEADTMVQGGVAVSVPSVLTSTGFTVSYAGSATPAPTPTPVPTPTPAPTVQVATITLGQPFNLVLTGGSPYLSVQWQVSTDGVTWTPLVNVTLDASGDSTYTITPSQTAYYRIYVPSSGQYSSWETEVIVTQPPTPTPIATPIPTPVPTPTPTPGPTASVPTIFTVTAGEPVTLTQSGPPSTALALQSSPDGVTWTSLAQLTTDASGNATYTFTPTATAYYRSLFPDGPSAAGVGVVLPAVSSGLALASPPVITWGSTASFTVAIAPGAVRQIDILATRDNIAWSTIASLTTNASGQATFTYRPATNLYYRAVFAGSPDLAGESSAAVRTVVRQIALPRLTDGGRLATVTRGTSVTFTTVLRPDRPELPAPVATFRVYRWSGSTWALYRTVVTTADASGVASLRWTFGAVGSWYVTSVADPTAYNANSVWTAPLRYDVR